MAMNHGYEQLGKLESADQGEEESSDSASVSVQSKWNSGQSRWKLNWWSGENKNESDSFRAGSKVQESRDRLISVCNYWDVSELEAEKSRVEILRDRLNMVMTAHDHASKGWNVWKSIRRLNDLQGALKHQVGHTKQLFEILSEAINQHIAEPEENMVYTTKTTICVPSAESHWNELKSFVNELKNTWGSQKAVAIARAADKDGHPEEKQLKAFKGIALLKKPYPDWWDKSVLCQMVWSTLTSMLEASQWNMLVPIILRLSKKALERVPLEKNQEGILAWTALPCVVFGPQISELPAPKLRSALEFQDRLDSIWTSIIPGYVFELSGSIVVMEKRCVEVRDRNVKLLGGLATLCWFVLQFMLKNSDNEGTIWNFGNITWPVGRQV